VAGLRATIPRTVTRPAATNSLACSRERASPRLTSSASNRALRGTLLTPVCARSGQEVVRLGKRVGQRGVHRLEPTDVLGNGQFTKLLEVLQRLLDRVHRSLPVFEVDLPRQHRRIRHNTVTGQLSHVPLLDHVARHDVSTLADGQHHNTAPVPGVVNPVPVGAGLPPPAHRHREPVSAHRRPPTTPRTAPAELRAGPVPARPNGKSAPGRPSRPAPSSPAAPLSRTPRAVRAALADQRRRDRDAAPEEPPAGPKPC